MNQSTENVIQAKKKKKKPKASLKAGIIFENNYSVTLPNFRKRFLRLPGTVQPPKLDNRQ